MSARSKIASPRAVNIEDLRRLAKARLPAAVFDYLDGGAEDEITLRENSRAFRDYISGRAMPCMCPSPHLQPP